MAQNSAMPRPTPADLQRRLHTWLKSLFTLALLIVTLAQAWETLQHTLNRLRNERDGDA
jgi:hypothetical protein